MKPRKQNNASADDAVMVAKRGQSREIIGRFLQNKAAVCGLVIASFLIFCALFPQLLTSYDPLKQDLSVTFQPPSAEHWFGTDDQGRDIFARVVYGCRYSLSIGLISVAISCVIGVFLGAVSGYYSGTVDNVIMRFIDILMAIPNTLLGISIVAALGPSIRNLIIAIAIGSISAYARITRVSVRCQRCTHHLEVCSSELPCTDYRTGNHEYRNCDHDSDRSEFLGTGRACTDTGMGLHGVFRKKLLP